MWWIILICMLVITFIIGHKNGYKRGLIYRANRYREYFHECNKKLDILEQKQVHVLNHYKKVS